MKYHSNTLIGEFNDVIECVSHGLNKSTHIVQDCDLSKIQYCSLPSESEMMQCQDVILVPTGLSSLIKI